MIKILFRNDQRQLRKDQVKVFCHKNISSPSHMMEDFYELSRPAYIFFHQQIISTTLIMNLLNFNYFRHLIHLPVRNKTSAY